MAEAGLEIVSEELARAFSAIPEDKGHKALREKYVRKLLVSC